MSKNLLQDMVKKNPRKEVGRPHERRMPELGRNPEDFGRGRQGPGKKYLLWIVAIISVIFFLFAVSFLFSKAVVTINPKMQDLVLNENFGAVKDATEPDLPFDLVAISGEESKNLNALAEKDVSLFAKGSIIIYNAFNTSPVVLSIDTKLIGSNLKTYKTIKKVTIPGMAKNGTPGSVEVGISALKAGAEYNSSPLDFKVLNFKGTAKYEKIYGRSKDEIIGGFVGKVSQVSPDDQSKALSGMRTTLEDSLLKKAVDQIPDGFILFKDAVFLDDDGGTLGALASDNTVPFVLKGTLYGFLLDEDKLTKKIVADNVKDYDGNDVYLLNIRDFKFSMSNIPNGASTWDQVKNINFNLSGTSKVVWKFDQRRLINDILGRPKKDFDYILSQYKNVASANSTITPFWRRSFPDKSKNIQIMVNYPK